MPTGSAPPPSAQSLVVIPFLEEDPRLVVRTVEIAASHPAVGEVVAVAGGHRPTNLAVTAALSNDLRAKVIDQQRIGSRRPGKGDAMNTGLRYFLEQTSYRAIHFFDSEIRTFGADWIDRAETAAALGYDAIRHYYPRSATDAMITWMVVRPGFALLWPHSVLPWIQQPLSGELMFTRDAAQSLAADPLVSAQSDWGIDTVLTYASAAHGFSLYESYVSAGKDHALYGTMADIKTMMLECLAALQSLRQSPPPRSIVHRVEYPHAVSTNIAEKIGFDIEATQLLLTSGWTERQRELLNRHFPAEVAAGAKSWQLWPQTSFLDQPTWLATLRALLDHFQLGDPDWEELAFRLWVGRVLQYTLTIAIRGHSFAIAYLNQMVTRAMAGAKTLDTPSRS